MSKTSECQERMKKIITMLVAEEGLSRDKTTKKINLVYLDKKNNRTVGFGILATNPKIFDEIKAKYGGQLQTASQSRKKQIAFEILSKRVGQYYDYTKKALGNSSNHHDGVFCAVFNMIYHNGLRGYRQHYSQEHKAILNNDLDKAATLLRNRGGSYAKRYNRNADLLTNNEAKPFKYYQSQVKAFQIETRQIQQAAKQYCQMKEPVKRGVKQAGRTLEKSGSSSSKQSSTSSSTKASSSSSSITKATHQKSNLQLKSPFKLYTPGGVRLSPKLTQSMGGLIFNTATRAFRTLKSKNPANGDNLWGDVTPSDLANAFDFVFIKKLSQHGASFSLDPADPKRVDGPYQRQVYFPPHIQGTAIGYNMWYADWKMKQLSFGINFNDNSHTQKVIESNIKRNVSSAFKSYFEISEKNQIQGQRCYSRLWFVVDRVNLKQYRSNNQIFQLIDGVEIQVKAMRMVPDPKARGGLKDIQTSRQDPCRQFAQLLTKELKKFQRTMYPSFRKLRVNVALIAIMQWLRDQMRVQASDLNMDWMRKNMTKCIKNQYKSDKVPRLERSQTKETITKKIQENKEITTKATSKRVISGGVNLTIGDKVKIKRIMANDQDQKVMDSTTSTAQEFNLDNYDVEQMDCFKKPLLICGLKQNCQVEKTGRILSHQKFIKITEDTQYTYVHKDCAIYYYRNKGNQLMSNKLTEEAVKLYTKALEIDPENASVLNNRSLAFTQLHQYRRAIDDAKKAIDSAYIQKSFWRLYQAEISCGALEDAVETLYRGCEEYKLSPDFVKELVKTQFYKKRMWEKKEYGINFNNPLLKQQKFAQLEELKYFEIGKFFKFIKEGELASAKEIIFGDKLNKVLSSDQIDFFKGVVLTYMGKQKEAEIFLNQTSMAFRLGSYFKLFKGSMNKMEELRQKAKEHFSSKNYMKAIEMYTQSEATDPFNRSLNAKNYFNIALCLENVPGIKKEQILGCLNKAISYEGGYEKAIKKRAEVLKYSKF